MLFVLISWVWIGLSAFLWGYAGLQIIKKVSGYQSRELDLTFMLGICFLTVYAQLFSLFYKVGAAATVILLLVNMIILLLGRKEIFAQIRGWMHSSEIVIKVVILAVLSLLMLMIAATGAAHYDTYLYHAQSIRWIEEYGIVPGLGNLHNRLAYNSSIFSLQALYSLKFLLGRSLHTINSFVVLVIVGYALCSFQFFKKRKFCTSDFMRLAVLIFMVGEENCNSISSPCSDILALGLVLYLFLKWLDYMERGEKEIAPYAILCLLGVFAVSVKLSVAMIVLLVIIPAVRLIAQKRWKQIAFYIGTGIVIIAPFLIRNVVISGYLIYPYPELDLFSVDWKMPEYTLLFDRNEIKTWGWGLNDVYRFKAPISEWFPVWTSKLGPGMDKLFYLDVLLLIPSLVVGIRKGIVKKEWDYLLIVGTMIACLLLWFLGSPLPRYGGVFLIILPMFVLGETLCYFQKERVYGFWTIPIALILIGYLVLPMFQFVSTNEFTEIKAPDYVEAVAEEHILDSEIIYVPVYTDQASYNAFPSTPYINILSRIELRGERLEQGFKMKDEYRNACVQNNGRVEETNMFE